MSSKISIAIGLILGTVFAWTIIIGIIYMSDENLKEPESTVYSCESVNKIAELEDLLKETEKLRDDCFEVFGECKKTLFEKNVSEMHEVLKVKDNR